MNATSKAHELLKFKPKRKKANASNWALSYGDIVTVLLCFFIIFYAIEKQLEKKTSAASVNDLVKELVPGNKTSNIMEHKTSGVEADYDFAIASLQEIEGIEIHKTSSFVDIIFNKTIFFMKGKFQLTDEGKVELNNVLSKFSKISDKYVLEIQGHADPSPVKNQKTRWWKSNMELSVLRALNVHTYLAENYIDKKNLIVSGYGSQNNFESSKQINEAANRRISLRLHLIK